MKIGMCLRSCDAVGSRRINVVMVQKSNLVYSSVDVVAPIDFKKDFELTREGTGDGSLG